MAKPRTKVPARIKAELQKEINSECPFCGSQDVGYFELHHIDANPLNSFNAKNLFMTCPACHSKISKGNITKQEVINKKTDLQSRSWKIEFSSVVVDSKVCNWKVSDTSEFSFFDVQNNKSPNPILNFSFINHLSKTVILKTIEAEVKRLPAGLSGFGPEPRILKPLIKYFLQFSYSNKINVLHLLNPIAVPTQEAFMFQLELSEGDNKNESYPIEGRMATYFRFKFSSDIVVRIPTVYFNCGDEKDPMILSVLT